MELLVLHPKNERSRKWKKDEKDHELWMHVPTGIWYVRKKMKGKKPLFRTTGYTTKGKARAEANNIISHWLGSSVTEFENQSLTFGEYAPIALEDWLNSSKYRPRYKINLKLYIGQLIEQLGHVRLVDITEGFIESWIESLKKDAKRKTYRDYVSYTTKVLRHAKRNGLIRSAPDFENPDPKISTSKPYTRPEMERLFAAAEKSLNEGRSGRNLQKYYRALCMMVQLRCCFNAFMRKRECLCAPWSEIDLKTGEWNMPPERVKMGSRTGRGKHIFVDPDLILPLLQELKNVQNEVFGFETKWLFPNPKDPTRAAFDNKSAWKSLKARAKISGKAEWHALRDTAMTWALLGDEKFQEELKSSCVECQQQMRARLKNPLVVAWYSGTDMRTIQTNYLGVTPEHTREMATCIRL